MKARTSKRTPRESAHEYLEAVKKMLAGQTTQLSEVTNGLTVRSTFSRTELTWHPEEGRTPAHLKVTARLEGHLEELAANGGYRVNRFATLGALIERDGQFTVESRLTIMQGENAGAIHVPLLAAATVMSADTMFRGMERARLKQTRANGASAWTARDIATAASVLEQQCFCTHGASALSAEIPLDADSVSAIAGHRNTALLRMSATAQHPDVGPGLFVGLELPHRFEDDEELVIMLDALNEHEAFPANTPPHFGAWCKGANLGNNPCYVTFLPNGLHVPGIAANLGVWNFHRARIAADVLAKIQGLAQEPHS